MLDEIENELPEEYKILPPDVKQNVKPVAEESSLDLYVDPREEATLYRAGKGIPFNAADMFDMKRAIESTKGLNKQYEYLDKANRARSLQQFSAPRLEAPKIYTGREKYIADNSAANMMLESVPDFTADSKLSMVSRLQRNAQAESMRQQGRLAETESITKQNAANTEVENKNRQMEAEAANKRSELLADIESKDS